ncbi:MAG: hypothetical protein ACXWZF_02485 [Actinomycetota bacterium]
MFIRVPEGESVKNRLHFDLRPDDQQSHVDSAARPRGHPRRRGSDRRGAMGRARRPRRATSSACWHHGRTHRERMTDVVVRRLQPGDEREVERFAEAFDDPIDAEATRSFLRDERHHLVVAYVDGRPASSPPSRSSIRTRRLSCS